MVVMEKAEQLGIESSTAENISRKFTKAFTLFADCYHSYSTCKKFNESDITSLG